MRAVVEGLGGVGVDLDHYAVRADRVRGYGQGGYEFAFAGGVGRVDEDGEMRHVL